MESKGTALLNVEDVQIEIAGALKVAEEAHIVGLTTLLGVEVRAVEDDADLEERFVSGEMFVRPKRQVDLEIADKHAELN